ncbi:hypothetical protein EW145_g6897 [Phellinidium pouzarii]|uniref:Uncharacterized protein n=1 Tax=Phellinidium pouzarii TaxID=167371 RepID=A0A4S4KSB6_9AGAM|nr:hypothetical protein EW145_g6897 [Phellinidium pouzarii]
MVPQYWVPQAHQKRYRAFKGNDYKATLDGEEKDADDGIIVNESAGSAATTYSAAGVDTKVGSALNTFLFAMVLHSDAQRRGQEELDCVVGKENLPTMEDKARFTVYRKFFFFFASR